MKTWQISYGELCICHPWTGLLIYHQGICKHVFDQALSKAGNCEMLLFMVQQGKSEQSCNVQTRSQSSIFWPVWHLNMTDDIHPWIQTGVIIWKHSNWIQIVDFSALWTWNLTNDLPCHLCIISKLSVNLDWSCSLERFNLGQIGVFCPVSLWHLTDYLQKQYVTSSKPLQSFVQCS